MTFSVDGLPEGLALDTESGIITGKTPSKAGDYPMTLRASNSYGDSSRTFTLVSGDTLALTPPMGWNSWYIHYDRVTDEVMRQAADAMVSSGMADYGYMYVNIDDCWMVEPGSDHPELGGEPRDADGAIRSNGRFPDMNGLTEYIHSKGLRAGLYTSPGPLTCQKFQGSHQHEEIDARKFAEWGFDFLKYDWCSYRDVATGEGLERLQRPYRLMGKLLEQSDRDIVYNLCQYGMGDVWNWGGEVGGNCWRTTGDLGLEKAQELPGFYYIGFKNAEHYENARPGEWNDPDYILIGWVGDAHEQALGEPTKLTPNEQYSYMSMWSLMAAPLIFSGDMAKLDEFTLNVLCNSEVIDIDQDPLGKQARIIRKTEEEMVLAKPLEDGSLAVGLFNLDEEERDLQVTWSELGVEGARMARDLWRQQDVGSHEGEFSSSVGRHGVFFFRLIEN
jgi:alpha-galactosidase